MPRLLNQPSPSERKGTGPLPRIIVITPVLNAEAFIADALDSVLAQDYPEVEHIVFDGGSTDGTAEILNRYPSARILRDADEGPHDVMNRGIAVASGEIIVFLNADDIIPRGVFAEVGKRFQEDPELDIVAGASAIINDAPFEQARVLVRRDHAEAGGLAYEELFLGVPCFNVRFFHRRLFRNIGNFDLDYFYSADRHFLIRARLSGAKSVTLDRVTCVFRSHGSSRTIDPAQSAADDIIAEHVRMVRYFAPKLVGNRPAYKLLKEWHAFECVRSACRNLKRFRLGAAIMVTVRGFVFDSVLPVSWVRGWRRWRRLCDREDRRACLLTDIL